ncbi:terpene synthase family protein [Streptomyces sp. NPDC003032]
MIPAGICDDSFSRPGIQDDADQTEHLRQRWLATLDGAPVDTDFHAGRMLHDALTPAWPQMSPDLATRYRDTYRDILASTVTESEARWRDELPPFEEYMDLRLTNLFGYWATCQTEYALTSSAETSTTTVSPPDTTAGPPSRATPRRPGSSPSNASALSTQQHPGRHERARKTRVTQCLCSVPYRDSASRSERWRVPSSPSSASTPRRGRMGGRRSTHRPCCRRKLFWFVHSLWPMTLVVLSLSQPCARSKAALARTMASRWAVVPLAAATDADGFEAVEADVAVGVLLVGLGQGTFGDDSAPTSGRSSRPGCGRRCRRARPSSGSRDVLPPMRPDRREIHGGSLSAVPRTTCGFREDHL